MLSTQLDELDAAPAWSCPPGTELPGGFLAWGRLELGPRCETWLVWSIPLWCPAVLRLPRPHQVEHPAVVRSLAREAAALRASSHPALPRLYRDGTGAGIPHVALEYVDGPTLDEELAANGPLETAEVALLGAQLLTALLALHRRGIAHVDLNPANIVLRDMRPVLTDFGSACRIGASPHPAERPTGTPGYAAPDLEAGEPITAGMDLYTLGAILHEALTGDPVFDPALPAARRPRPRSLGRHPLAEVVHALLHPDPARRPHTHEALTAFADTVPADLRPWPTWADPLARATAVTIRC